MTDPMTCLLAIAVVILIVWLFMVHANREEAHREVADRADRQHGQCMSGDDRGMYGDYPPVDL